MAFSRLSNDELQIRLSGCWTLAEGVPSTDDVRIECEGAAPPSRVTFDTQAITEWDSALPTFLRGLLELFAIRGIDADRSGLPEGARRLLDLAAAVPETEVEVDTAGGSRLARLGASWEKSRSHSCGLRLAAPNFALQISPSPSSSAAPRQSRSSRW